MITLTADLAACAGASAFRAVRAGARIALALGALLACAAIDARAQPNSAAPYPVVVNDTALAPVDSTLASAGTLPFAVAARVSSGRASRLDVLSARNVPLWVLVDLPASLNDVERWRQSLQDLLGRYTGHVTAIEIDVTDQPADLAAFAIRLASTEARALAPGARVALGGERMRSAASRGDLYNAELAPYIDLLVVGADEADDAARWLERIDPGSRVAAVVPDQDAGGTLVRRIMSNLLRFAGGRVETAVLPGSDAVVPALKALAAAPSLLSSAVAAMDDSGSDLKIAAGAADVAARLTHQLLFDNRSFATYLALPEGTASPLEVSVRLAADAQPVIVDLTTGQRRNAEGVSWDATSRIVRLRVPASSSPLLVDFNRDAAEVVGDRSEVVGRRGLSIEEIIARHQAVQRRQDVRVQTYIANAETSQHFRPSVADPGYDVVTENRYFVAGDAIEWEELSFSVNGAKWGADRPPFPLLQPEKVLSLPLQLRFGSGYRYRLDGEASVNGYDCYVVRFEPTRTDVPLYRGTVWIDQRSFARIRVQAVQGGLPAPVVSNEEIQDYAPPVMVGDQPVFLLNALTARQIVMIAGRNLLVEKLVRFSDFRVNDSGFETARAAARGGDRIMFRETDGGLRYYLKQNGERVVSEHPTQSAKALAMGIYVDPSYAFPLPILGINYLNFAFGGPDSQLAVLFGGVLAAGNIQRSKLWGSALDASVDFFGIAVPSSDRLYAPGGELNGERVMTWPMSTGLNVGWQYTPFQKLTGQYQFRFDAYAHDRTTADDFTLPTSTVTNGGGFTWEYRRGGFTLVASDTEFRRARWKAWGPGVDPAATATSSRSYAKYQATLSRDWYFKTFQKVHLNGAYFGGRDLDRFSKYQFGMFDDTRIHGVPASGVRYAQLGMMRGSYTLNIFDIYRVDLFAEQAWGRDRPNGWEPMTGLGVAVNFRAPRSTILRADFGKSILPDRFRSVGSYTLQVLVLKPLR
jgi:hypothetical protein